MSPVFRSCSLGTVGVASLGVLSLASCQADVSLGRWGERPNPTVVVGDAAPDSVGSTSAPPGAPESNSDGANGSRDDTGGAADAGAAEPAPACQQDLGGGTRSSLTGSFVVTETSTDWSLPEPTTGMEWTLTIEYDPPEPPTGPTVGYYWHNQFSFVPGIAGRIGLQDNGYYDPKTGVPGSTEYTKMAVFWLSGPPLAAEIGDVEGRAAPETAVGLSWQTIHAKFEWEECHTYRFKVDIESTEPNGDMWYGAWITDETEGKVSFLGRMLMPADSGLLSTLTSTRTSPIRFGGITSCDQLYQTSATFGAPTSTSGQRAVHVGDHFFQPFGCRRSLIADYDGAVRHQLSVPRQ